MASSVQVETYLLVADLAGSSSCSRRLKGRSRGQCHVWLYTNIISHALGLYTYYTTFGRFLRGQGAAIIRLETVLAKHSQVDV